MEKKIWLWVSLFFNITGAILIISYASFYVFLGLILTIWANNIVNMVKDDG
jgi:hypothetical protein